MRKIRTMLASVALAGCLVASPITQVHAGACSHLRHIVN